MRARWIAVWAVAAAVLLPMVFVAGIYVTHPRNESGFIGQLHSASLPDVWITFVDDHDDTFLIEEGDRACRWLSAQPLPFMSSANKYELENMMDRYLAETKEDPDWDMRGANFAGRRVVAASAWNHLCQATMLIHRPYHPFGD
jgi:hypothetical protein